MASSLGEGIGLQSGNRSDYWMRRLAEDQRIDDANKREDEKELAKLLDFKIDYGKYYPKFGRAIAKEYQTLINNVAKMRQSNPHVTSGMIQAEALKAQQKIGTYEMSNAAYKEYIGTKDILKDQDLIADVISDGGTVADLQKHSDPKFLRIGPLGEFSYTAVAEKTKETKFDTNVDYIENEKQGKDERGFRQFITTRSINPLAIEREAAQLWNDKPTQMQILYGLRKELPNMTDDETVEAIKQAAIGRAQQEAPIGFYKDEWKQLPQGPSGGQNPKVAAPLQYNTVVTAKKYKTRPDGKLELKKNDITGKFDPIQEGDSQINIPLSIALPNSKPVTIQLNDKTFDTETNLYLKNKSESVSFRANGIELVPVKGGYKSYAVGDIVKNVGTDANGEPVFVLMSETPEAEKRETVFRIKVPLDETGQVNSMARSLNPREMNSYDQGYKKFMESNKGGGKALPVITTQAEYDALPVGTKYTDSTGKPATKR